MAATGTATASFAANHFWGITITAITQASNSPSFEGKALPYSSYVVEGTAGAGFGGQWQGSNDGGVTWVNIGNSITSLPTAGTLTGNGMIFGLYRFVVSGGDGTTSVNAYVKFAPSY